MTDLVVIMQLQELWLAKLSDPGFTGQLLWQMLKTLSVGAQGVNTLPSKSTFLHTILLLYLRLGRLHAEV